ncbi:peptidase ld-carboxypeptidase a [Grosmannia clavigera kw1407]|uniref:Peptidase ld-carboxypeptidase a n=1 Tax=Grosmannia clavigera (strain kw1407 / UAMH 11150) TaxID=655863 RepID=F0XBA5_GROCL|nr:peptidase ld-carboxypeptidase a [Grosmannia clavigera kw1407]EFX05023.1 peptidase ld-carboxypeptidase a [Grosmannia clavigera kw1407]
MAIIPNNEDFVRPPPIEPTSIIRVVSPAGAVKESALKAGREYLETAGYQVNQPETVTERYNYFAGNAASRAQELHKAVLLAKGHESIIWAARGGYGSSQMAEYGLTVEMLHDLHQELTQNPKWLVGYSDITSISLHLWARARVLVLHGPMVVNITEYSPEAVEETWKILKGSEPLTQVFTGNIRYGKGQGLLANGRSLAGIAFGQMTMPDGYASDEYGAYDVLLVPKVLHELLEPLGIPIITDVDIGHDTRTARPIVLGAQAEIHGNGVLKVLVPGCYDGVKM